jgi:hypothetical protein
MNITELAQHLTATAGNARFVSFTYRDKKREELARYTLIIGASYRQQCLDSITELEIRAKSAQGIEAQVITEMIASLRESVTAIDTGTSHSKNTKAGQYLPVCNGIKINLNDSTLELCGLQHTRTVLEKGKDLPKVNHRNEATALKAKLRRELPIGRYKTLCLDSGRALTAKLNGETIEFAD